MTVRPAVAADVPAVLELIRAIPALPQWNRDALAVAGGAEDRGVAGGPVRCLLIAEDEGRLAGFAQMLVVQDEAELESMAVGPAWRRRGVGSMLLRHAIDAVQARGAEVCRLEVRQSNEAALRLYGALGFSVTGTRRGYYSDPVEDALLLQLSWADCG